MAELWSPIVLEKGLSYPNMTDCMVVGISGNCGGSCPVLRQGKCETQYEMEGELSIEDRIALHSSYIKRFT